MMSVSSGFVSMDSSVERENADANNQPSADLNEVQLLQEEPELGAGIEGGEVVTHHVEGLAQEGKFVCLLVFLCLFLLCFAFWKWN